jgi:hypothetical protein
MSITLNLPAELVEQLKRISNLTGESEEAIISRGIQREIARLPSSAISKRGLDLSQLLQYAGSIDTTDPASGDNARIDADLIASYSDQGQTN